MHISLGTVVSSIGVLGFLVVVAGILGAAFRTSRNVQSIANYRDAAQSWEARANAQEQEIAQQAQQIEKCNHQLELLRQELAAKDKEVAGLQEQITSMRELLTGRAAFESLTGKISEAVQLAGENRRDIRRLLEIETGKAPP